MLSCSPLPTAPGNHRSIFCVCDLMTPDTSYKEHHTVFVLCVHPLFCVFNKSADMSSSWLSGIQQFQVCSIRPSQGHFWFLVTLNPGLTWKSRSFWFSIERCRTSLSPSYLSGLELQTSTDMSAQNSSYNFQLGPLRSCHVRVLFRNQPEIRGNLYAPFVVPPYDALLSGESSPPFPAVLAALKSKLHLFC